jgi:carbon catabolite-derepressing protein kinase
MESAERCRKLGSFSCAVSPLMNHHLQVRMDIQLYQLDGMNFVVDFRNAGYYKATESSHPPARFDTDTGEPFEEGEQEVKNMEVSNSFLFLDCACQLIIELAGGT